jgi:aldose 1-epimerase
MEKGHFPFGGPLKGAPVVTLASGNLEADFLPNHGMLCMSLRDRKTEILRRVDDLEAAASKGGTAAIPLLYPWANRLSSLGYRAAGIEVVLDRSSPKLHFDDNDLPIHGVPWAQLTWEVVIAREDQLAARLDWRGADLLRVFPFPHRIELTATLRPSALTFETTLIADRPMPISFGFHPYIGIPNLRRSEWHLVLPPMRRLVLDGRGIPTGAEEPFGGFNAALDDFDFDDAFALDDERAILSIAGSNRRISVEILTGYRYAQVFAPKGKDFIALEPMTASIDALNTGRGLRLIGPGEIFRAGFRIRIDKSES